MGTSSITDQLLSDQTQQRAPPSEEEIQLEVSISNLVALLKPPVSEPQPVGNSDVVSMTPPTGFLRGIVRLSGFVCGDLGSAQLHLNPG